MNSIGETVDELNNITNDDTLQYFSFDGEVHLAKVVDCYDGDTITCIFKHDNKYMKFKIRMDGYDSPEMKPSKTIPEEKRIEIKKNAMIAKKYIESLILHKNIYVFCKAFDKYGRLLADIKINKDDRQTINEMMINGGYGYEYHGGTKILDE